MAHTPISPTDSDAEMDTDLLVLFKRATKDVFGPPIDPDGHDLIYFWCRIEGTGRQAAFFVPALVNGRVDPAIFKSITPSCEQDAILTLLTQRMNDGQSIIAASEKQPEGFKKHALTELNSAQLRLHQRQINLGLTREEFARLLNYSPKGLDQLLDLRARIAVDNINRALDKAHELHEQDHIPQTAPASQA